MHIYVCQKKLARARALFVVHFIERLIDVHVYLEGKGVREKAAFSYACIQKWIDACTWCSHM